MVPIKIMVLYQHQFEELDRIKVLVKEIRVAQVVHLGPCLV